MAIETMSACVLVVGTGIPVSFVNPKDRTVAVFQMFSLFGTVNMSLSLSLCLRLNSHFPGEPGLASVY